MAGFSYIRLPPCDWDCGRPAYYCELRRTMDGSWRPYYLCCVCSPVPSGAVV